MTKDKKIKEIKNEEIVKILREIAKLLEIEGIAFKPRAYQRAAEAIEKLDVKLSEIYQKEGIKGLQKIKGVGKSIAQKIEEILKTGKSKYLEELKEKNRIRIIVTHYFETKGVNLEQLKRDARKRKIIYSRFTKPAKQLLELAGSLEKALEAIDRVAAWAKSRNLDYAIETVFKKWLELDRLKPKEVVKKPYFQGNPMVWSETKKKWYVISPEGEWLEFAGKESDIEWRIEK